MVQSDHGFDWIQALVRHSELRWVRREGGKEPGTERKRARPRGLWLCVLFVYKPDSWIHCMADCLSASVSQPLAMEAFFYDRSTNIDQNLHFFRIDRAERVNGSGKNGS